MRVIALYQSSGDEPGFLERYERTHRPLLEAIPDLRDLRVTRVSHKGGVGQPSFSLMAEMNFDDRASFARAMCSREHRVARSDLRSFSVDPVTLILVDEP